MPRDTPGVKIEEYLWTFNMPTDHPRVSFTNVWVPEDSTVRRDRRRPADRAGFVHENRIRQAARRSAQRCTASRRACSYARERKPFGKALAENQAIQWPLVELATQARCCGC